MTYIQKNQKTKSEKKYSYGRTSLTLKIFIWSFFALSLLALGYTGFFIWKISDVEKETGSGKNKPSGFFETAKNLTFDQNLSDLKGFEEGRINILLLGIAGEGKPGQNLTDTLMVASVNTKTNQVALISLPRDMYVEIPELGVQSKINSIYQTGINDSKEDYADYSAGAQLIRRTIEKILNINIDYYVVLNFDGFEKIVDSIDGINITNERDIFDARYPGPNYSYETFELSKGFHQLDGKTALKYARERHNDPEGDFGRAKRQQQVLQAIKNKIYSARTLLNGFAMNELLNTLGDNIKTDIRASEVGDFLELSKKLDTTNINTVVVDAWNKNSLLKVSHIFHGDARSFVLVPRAGNYSEIHDLAENVFDLNKIKRQREEIVKENASVAIVNKSGDPSLAKKIKKLLSENLEYKNVSVVSTTEKNSVSKTFVYNLSSSKAPFTLDEIIKKLPATLSQNNYEADFYLKKNQADILIVLGKDLPTLYNMEEASVEEWKKAEQEN